MKKTQISFDMETTSDISDMIIEVDNDFYTKKTTKVCGSLRFPIPAPIKAELQLKAGDICFFCTYSEGFYISFKIKPEAATKAQVKSRKLASAGMYGTLYVCIPPMIKNLYQEEISGVKLIRTKGFKPYEWQLQFLFFKLIINERLRKYLGINLKNKKIYVFKVNHKTYLSINAIPKTGEAKRLNVKLGNHYWYINIPFTYLEYIPASYKLLNTKSKVLELVPDEK